jgi:signal transduction histidine kinase
MLLAEFQSKQAASVTNITLYVFIIVGLCLVLLLLLIRKAQLDILLYKRTEEKLTHFNEELQAQVQSQTADLRRLTNYLQNIREEEQTRIARELHDELGQQLTVLKMEASSLKKNIGAPGEVVEKKFEDHLALIDAAIQSVRRISSDLRPLVLDELGLVAAMEGHLNEFERRTDIRTIFEHPEEVPEIPVQTQTTLFRIFQESLTNIARYAKASEVRVTLTHHKDLLQLCIQDNGVGFDPQLVKGKKTLGILGMRERCEMMGGRFTMESAPGKGTMVRVSLAI